MKHKNGLLSYLQGTLSEASGYHNEALGRAADSRSAYRGDPYGNEEEGKSSIVVKDIRRTVHGALPSLVEPFISDEIVRITSENPEGMEGARKQEALINYQWSKLHRPLEIMETVGLNLMVDGTVWLMSGWNAKGHPTVEVVPFESVIPDPAAYTPEEMRFVIYRRKVSIGEIRSNPDWYGKQSDATLSQLVPSNESDYEPEQVAGREDTFNPDDRSLELVEVFEYYGYYDLDGNGTPKPIIAIWSGNQLLRIDESPYPFGPIPFDSITFGKIPFSLYGFTITDLIGDYQRLRTSITRGIIDNMANSNNGIKFIRKGSLDPVNYKRLQRGERFVEINSPSATGVDALIYDGNFNPLPPDVYKMLEDLQKEEENLSGITRYAIGSDSRSLNQTATGVGIISSMSQRRLIYITRHISAAMERVFAKWAAMNAKLIRDVVIPTDDGYERIIGPELPSDGMGITITTPTEGIKQQRNSEIASMLNAVSPMVPYTGPEPVLGLLMELASNMEMPNLKKQLSEAMRRLPEQQAQMAQMSQQMEQMKAQIEMMKQSASARKDIASAEKYEAEADRTRYETLANSFGVDL